MLAKSNGLVDDSARKQKAKQIIPMVFFVCVYCSRFQKLSSLKQTTDRFSVSDIVFFKESAVYIDRTG